MVPPVRPSILASVHISHSFRPSGVAIASHTRWGEWWRILLKVSVAVSPSTTSPPLRDASSLLTIVAPGAARRP